MNTNLSRDFRTFHKHREMAAVIKELVKGYHYLNNDMADPRTNHWALVSSPVPVVLILLGYLYIVNKWGIEFMKNRQPYQLKNTIIFFNITQILFNVWMFYEVRSVS
uniref:Very-long-chain 3-oxoacyl-CoA synthase n=1 Tax=Timema tahoe TaxID=61484 RepID=A0A7R9IT71_9NEOP|nr:unnamed protein product [Timema tahoe]